MSEMEYNKGTLKPIPWGAIFQWYPSASVEDVIDDPEMYGLEIIDNEPYYVLWEYECTDIPDIKKATKNADGSIDFETYHYNGGASWQEMVEQGLKNNPRSS